jgi:hypothetical protein
MIHVPSTLNNHCPIKIEFSDDKLETQAGGIVWQQYFIFLIDHSANRDRSTIRSWFY